MLRYVSNDYGYLSVVTCNFHVLSLDLIEKAVIMLSSIIQALAGAGLLVVDRYARRMGPLPASS